MLNIMIRKALSCLVALAVFWTSVDSGHAAELSLGAMTLPAPGTMVGLSPAAQPPVLKGVKVYADEPFRFDFIMDKGDGTNGTPADQDALKSESAKLIRYFLSSLTVPEKDLWVNLSPYEKDRIITDEFGMTEMGRDLLAQDYLLKQLTASVIYPEGETGKKFWAEVYRKAFEKYGTTDIPVDTFNKVWIVPEKAVVYEKAAGSRQPAADQSAVAYVVDAKLKVMLESDYLASSRLPEGRGIAKTEAGDSSLRPSGSAQNDTQTLAKDVLREVVIPVLEKEVNEGANFAQLRQVYYSLILAAWYKRKVKASLLSAVYVDRKKMKGIDAEGQTSDVRRQTLDPEVIWAQYVQAFKKGAYNYIKEEQDLFTGETIPRKYFSGGMKFGNFAMSITQTPPAAVPGLMVVSSDFAMTDSDGKTIDLNVVQKSRPESGTADLADRHDKDQGTQREIARLPGLFEEAFSTKRVREEFLYEKMSLALMWTPIPMMEELRKELAKAARPFGNMVTLHNTRRAFVNNIMQEGVKQGTHLYQKIGTVTYDFRDPRSASRGLIQGARDLKHGDFGSVDFKDIVAVVIAPDDGYVQEHLAKIRDNLETYGYSWNTDFWWEPVRAIHAVDLSLTDAELEAIKAQVEEFAGRHADEAGPERLAIFKERLTSIGVVYLWMRKLIDGFEHYQPIQAAEQSNPEPDRAMMADKGGLAELPEPIQLTDVIYPIVDSSLFDSFAPAMKERVDFWQEQENMVQEMLTMARTGKPIDWRGNLKDRTRRIELLMDELGSFSDLRGVPGHHYYDAIEIVSHIARTEGNPVFLNYALQTRGGANQAIRKAALEKIKQVLFGKKMAKASSGDSRFKEEVVSNSIEAYKAVEAYLKGRPDALSWQDVPYARGWCEKVSRELMNRLVPGFKVEQEHKFIPGSGMEDVGVTHHDFLIVEDEESGIVWLVDPTWRQFFAHSPRSASEEVLMIKIESPNSPYSYSVVADLLSAAGIRRDWHGIWLDEVTRYEAERSKAKEKERFLEGIIRGETSDAGSQQEKKSSTKIGSDRAMMGLDKIAATFLAPGATAQMKATALADLVQGDPAINKELNRIKSRVTDFNTNAQYFIDVDERPVLSISFVLKELQLYGRGFGEYSFFQAGIESSGSLSLNDFLNIRLDPVSGAEPMTMSSMLKEKGMLHYFENGLPIERGGVMVLNKFNKRIAVVDNTSEAVYSVVRVNFNENGRLLSTGVSGGSIYEVPRQDHEIEILGFHFHPQEVLEPSVADAEIIVRKNRPELIVGPSGRGRIWLVKNMEEAQRYVQSPHFQHLDMLSLKAKNEIMSMFLNSIEVDLNPGEQAKTESDRAMTKADEFMAKREEYFKIFDELMFTPTADPYELKAEYMGDSLTALPMALESRREELAKAAQFLGKFVTIHNAHRYDADRMLRGKEYQLSDQKEFGFVSYDFQNPNSVMRGLAKLAAQFTGLEVEGWAGDVFLHDFVAMICDPNNEIVRSAGWYEGVEEKYNAPSMGHKWVYKKVSGDMNFIFDIDLSLNEQSLDYLVQDYISDYTFRHPDASLKERDHARKRLKQVALIYYWLGQLTEGFKKYQADRAMAVRSVIDNPALGLKEDDKAFLKMVQRYILEADNGKRYGFRYNLKNSKTARLTQVPSRPPEDVFRIVELTDRGGIQPREKQPGVMDIAPLTQRGYRDASGRIRFELQDFDLLDPVERGQNILGKFLEKFPAGTFIRFAAVINNETLVEMAEKAFGQLQARHEYGGVVEKHMLLRNSLDYYKKLLERHEKFAVDPFWAFLDDYQEIRARDGIVKPLEALFQGTPFSRAMQRNGYSVGRVWLGWRETFGGTRERSLNFWVRKPGKPDRVMADLHPFSKPLQLVIIAPAKMHKEATDRLQRYLEEKHLLKGVSRESARFDADQEQRIIYTGGHCDACVNNSLQATFSVAQNYGQKLEMLLPLDQIYIGPEDFQGDVAAATKLKRAYAEKLKGDLIAQTAQNANWAMYWDAELIHRQNNVPSSPITIVIRFYTKTTAMAQHLTKSDRAMAGGEIKEGDWVKNKASGEVAYVGAISEMWPPGTFAAFLTYAKMDRQGRFIEVKRDKFDLEELPAKFERIEKPFEVGPAGQKGLAMSRSFGYRPGMRLQDDKNKMLGIGAVVATDDNKGEVTVLYPLGKQVVYNTFDNLTEMVVDETGQPLPAKKLKATDYYIGDAVKDETRPELGVGRVISFLWDVRLQENEPAKSVLVQYRPSGVQGVQNVVYEQGLEGKSRLIDLVSMPAPQGKDAPVMYRREFDDVLSVETFIAMLDNSDTETPFLIRFDAQRSKYILEIYSPQLSSRREGTKRISQSTGLAADQEVYQQAGYAIETYQGYLDKLSETEDPHKFFDNNQVLFIGPDNQLKEVAFILQRYPQIRKVVIAELSLKNVMAMSRKAFELGLQDKIEIVRMNFLKANDLPGFWKNRFSAAFSFRVFEHTINSYEMIDNGWKALQKVLARPGLFIGHLDMSDQGLVPDSETDRLTVKEKALKREDDRMVVIADRAMAGEPSRSAKEFVTLLVQSEKTGPLRILGLSSGAAEDELFLARQGHAVIASDSDIQKTLPAVQEGRAEGRQIEGRSIDLKAPIPLEDASVDAIYWRLGAQYLTNQELTQAAKEMYRVLRPGGTIYVVVKSKSDPYYQQFGGTEGSDGMVRYQDSQDKQWYSRNFLDDDAVRKIFEQFGEPTVTHSQEKLYQDIHESALTTFVGQKPDRAMGEEKGGIDLNAADSTLQVNATGQAMKFHIDPAMLERVENAPGLTPVILNIEPLDSLPAFLGLREDGGAENVVSATYGDGGRRRNVVRRVSVPVPRLRPEITQISSGYSRPYSAGSS